MEGERDTHTDTQTERVRWERMEERDRYRKRGGRKRQRD